MKQKIVNPTHIFLDLDHTLLDTDRFFWGDFSKHLLARGVPEDLWKETYWEVWKEGYSPRKHYRKILQKAPARKNLPSFSAFCTLLEQFGEKLPEYLYPDVAPFLQEAKKNGFSLFLLTFGEVAYQKWKVMHLRLSDSFEQVVFLGKRKKGEWIAQFRPDGRIVVVDNNPQELDEVKKLLPHAETYWISRSRDSLTLYGEASLYEQIPSVYPHFRIFALTEIPLAP
ncbi:MAG: HAD family hydrolase [bacterium JZ-2024 1]